MVPRGDGEDLHWHLQEVIGAGPFLDHVQGACGCHGSTVPQGTVCMPASKAGQESWENHNLCPQALQGLCRAFPWQSVGWLGGVGWQMCMGLAAPQHPSLLLQCLRHVYVLSPVSGAYRQRAVYGCAYQGGVCFCTQEQMGVSFRKACDGS